MEYNSQPAPLFGGGISQPSTGRLGNAKGESMKYLFLILYRFLYSFLFIFGWIVASKMGFTWVVVYFIALLLGVVIYETRK